MSGHFSVQGLSQFLPIDGFLGQLADFLGIVGEGVGIIACAIGEPCGAVGITALVISGVGVVLFIGDQLIGGSVAGPAYVTFSNDSSFILANVAAIVNTATAIIYNQIQYTLLPLVHACDIYYSFSFGSGLSLGTNPQTCPVPFHI